MKKIAVFSLLLCFSLGAFAQSLSIPSKWGVKKWSLSLGQDQDMLGSVEHDYLLSTVRGNTTMDYSNLDFQEKEITSMTCENPHLRFIATLPVPGRKNLEFNVAALLVVNKIDEVDYYNPGFDDNFTGEQSMSFRARSHEVGLEAGLMKNWSVGKAINLYGGAGTSAGVSGGRINISGENMLVDDKNEILNFSRAEDEIPANNVTLHQRYNDNYQMKTGWYQRGFLQAGIGFVLFRRVELGMEYRYGVGYRAIEGAGTKGTRYKSAAVKVSYLLK